MKKIILVSHCILNTAAKVVMYNEQEMAAEETLRKKFLKEAIDNDIHIIQLPCPEFTLYGAHRWGHVSNQFDNIFFRNHCREILKPVLEQLREYLNCDDMFQVLGIVGVDGSPSCGVDYTCEGNWYGSFEERKNLEKTLHTAKLISKSGIMMQVLKEMLSEEKLDDKVILTALYAPEPNKCLDLITNK